MGRRSVAEKIYEKIEPGEEEGCNWIVTYDFSSKANPKFWSNLHRLSAHSPGSRLMQQSVYFTESRRVARAVVSLAIYCGASVDLFKCLSIESIDGLELPITRN